ncbi:MAG: hypothetical protein HYU74_00530 [Dechloromonas sp.]|nr:hypothetical protein [Dechloromonas sp.]
MRRSGSAATFSGQRLEFARQLGEEGAHLGAGGKAVVHGQQKAVAAGAGLSRVPAVIGERGS